MAIQEKEQHTRGSNWSLGMKQKVITFITICQINKAEHTPYPGLLEPLLVPDWTHISMDFVEGLPLSDNKDLILVEIHKVCTFYFHEAPHICQTSCQDVH